MNWLTSHDFAIQGTEHIYWEHPPISEDAQMDVNGLGVGLGLPIVKNIMEDHGGGVEVKRVMKV